MRRQFGKTIVELAERDPKLVLLYGDVKQEMDEFERRFPDRIYNMGIAEQSSMSIAAGLALEGFHPVFYSLTPFAIERPFEQIKIDVDIHNLPVMIVGYADYPGEGPTQHELDAPGLASLLKSTKCFTPSNSEETARAMYEAHQRFSNPPETGRPSIISLKRDRSYSES